MNPPAMFALARESALATKLCSRYRLCGCFALMFAALAFCTGTQAKAQTQQTPARCPWLNAATAAGVLGGEVRMTVTRPEKITIEQPNSAPGDATCEFTLSGGTTGALTGAMLRIAVHTMTDNHKEYAAYVATCGPSARRLVGVGNEAIACSLPGGTLARDQVIARVRQRAFILTLSTPRPAGDAHDTQAVIDKLQNTAEQVAGSLF